ncbi:MAG: hypothetical protein WBA93_02725 [Microcoleaceae cyanobacterium]
MLDLDEKRKNLRIREKQLVVMLEELSENSQLEEPNFSTEEE